MHVLTYWTRQSRRVSFRLLLVALVLAIAAISSVGVFSKRLDAALQRNATQLLGGDLVVISKRAPDTELWHQKLNAPQFGQLRFASSILFPSVITTAQHDLLVSLKAVSNEYPLRGKLTIRGENNAETKVTHGPPSGEVWVDEGVLGSLAIKLGDLVSVGQVKLRVSKLILVEPDRGAAFVNFAPRLMMNKADLPQTGLLTEGSRARWRTYVAGPAPKIEAFRKYLAPMLSPTDSLETVKNGRPEVDGTLSKARDFLSMAALIGTLVACVGIALIAHQFASEQASEMSILKSLGYTPKQLLRVNLAGLGLLTLIGGGVGVALGWMAHWALLYLLESLLAIKLPMAGLYYLPFGVLLAALLLIGFASVPVARALQAPAIAVIRKQQRVGYLKQVLWSVGFGVAAMALVCVMVVPNFKLSMLLLAGFLGSCLLFGLVFWLLFRGLGQLQKLRESRKPGIALARSMSKRSGLLVIQGVSLSLGLSALMILAVVQGDLIDRWQAVIPADAPNRFAFNVQPDQKEGLQKEIERITGESVELYPMVRGRLVKINNTIINANTFKDERAQSIVEREFNLSYAKTMADYNQLLAGQWFNPEGTEQEVSVEDSVAKRLGLSLGDWLVFDIAGVKTRVQITSIRKVRWDSMKVNFYFVFPPKVMRQFPETWITAYYAKPAVAEKLTLDLVKKYPNVTVLNTALIIGQLRSVLSQVSQAIQFVFLFTVLAGGLVVAACVVAGARTRMQESALYRVMGATSRQLQTSAWLELAVIGALAGLLAAASAELVGWSLAHYIFEFEYLPSLATFIVGMVAGALASLLFGGWSVRKVCRVPVMQTLRRVDS